MIINYNLGNLVSYITPFYTHDNYVQLVEKLFNPIENDDIVTELENTLLKFIDQALKNNPTITMMDITGIAMIDKIREDTHAEKFVFEVLDPNQGTLVSRVGIDFIINDLKYFDLFSSETVITTASESTGTAPGRMFNVGPAFLVYKRQSPSLTR